MRFSSRTPNYLFDVCSGRCQVNTQPTVVRELNLIELKPRRVLSARRRRQRVDGVPPPRLGTQGREVAAPLTCTRLGSREVERR